MILFHHGNTGLGAATAAGRRGEEADGFWTGRETGLMMGAFAGELGVGMLGRAGSETGICFDVAARARCAPDLT